MLALLQRYLLPIAFGAGVLAGSALTGLGGHYWQKWVHDPAIRKDALKGYVAEAEKSALNAAIEKKARDLAAAEKANDTLRNQLAEADKAHEAATAKMEQDIKTYETLLATSGRACPLDDADRNWMLGRAPSPSK
jgi:hypothetical protein